MDNGCGNQLPITAIFYTMLSFATACKLHAHDAYANAQEQAQTRAQHMLLHMHIKWIRRH